MLKLCFISVTFPSTVCINYRPIAIQQSDMNEEVFQSFIKYIFKIVYCPPFVIEKDIFLLQM